MDQTIIRRRLIALRERRGVSQAELARGLGFNDRQTLSDIELGKRKISPSELVRAAGFLGVQPDYFTDPFELAGEARFSWRRTGEGNDLESFETRAGRWIATYRYLQRLKGDSVNSLLTQVDLTPRSSFEEAATEGDAISRALELGDIPATRLAAVLENELDTLVLHVDTIAGVSGAACQLGPLNTIIINRQEVEGRRSFDLGHEFFHLLTWQQMPPRHIEQDEPHSHGLEARVERLANSFASGLLMPSGALDRWVAERPLPARESELISWLKQTASHFRVSGQALKWRLVGLGLLKKAVAQRIDDAALRADGAKRARIPPPFSRPFMVTLGWGLTEGHLSVRRAASILGVTIDGLADLFAQHDLETPFDL